MQDQLTVLTTADGKRLAKVVTRDAEGYHVEGYEAGARYAWSVIDVAGLDDIEDALHRLAGDRQSCVIRGAIRDGSQHKAVVNRCHHVQADGRQPDWDHAAPGRRWVAFDIDKLALPSKPFGDMGSWLEGVARMARDRLPEPFRTSGCVYKLSSSAGLDGWETVSLHLWLWLDRPVYDLSWREWAEGVEVDSSLFKSVQPHYTADPAFDGCADPLRGLRIGRLDGVSDEVAVPVELLGYADWLEKHKAAIRARQAELEEARKRIVGGMQQTRSATRRYAAQALAGAVDDILSAPVGGRHAMLVTKAFKMGGYVQDGFLGEAELLSALEQAVSATFPPKRHREELRAVREMVTAGMAQPLDLSHIGRGKPRLTVVRDEPEEVGEVDGALARKRSEVDDAAQALREAKTEDERKKAARELAKAKRREAVEEGREPAFVQVRDDGSVPATTENVEALFAFYGVSLRHNVMTREAEMSIAGASFPSDIEMQAMMAHIRQLARRHRMAATKELDDAVTCIRASNVYHPVRDWILSKPWDGVDRFEALWRTLRVRKEHQERAGLYKSMLRAWMVSGAKFALLPFDAKRGLDAHGVLVLQGDQGVGKTKWLNRLVPLDSGWMKDGVTIDPSNKDDIGKATKFWLVELGEIDATIRKADIAALKGFLTADSDVYRRPYERSIEQFARRTFFAASVNPEMFLRDETGNRRFWVIPVEACLWNPEDGFSVESIDVQQLWAQFASLAEAGESHVLSRELEVLQREAVETHRKTNPLEDEVRRKFRLVDATSDKSLWMSNEEVFEAMSSDDDAKLTHADKMRVAEALASFGATKARRKVGAAQVRIWSVVRALGG